MKPGFVPFAITCTQYSCSLKESFNRYTFADGTPFGIKEGADD